jgi:lysine decarboxylase
MNLIHSSSPSYPLMISIEESIALLEQAGGVTLIERMKSLSDSLIDRLERLKGYEVYSSHFATDPAHILLRSTTASAENLAQYLQEERIFPEALLGSGVLLMLGVGSDEGDVDILLDALQRFALATAQQNHSNPHQPKPSEFEQVLSPRQAFFMPSDVVPVAEAIGRISHECVAPCPPGIPVTVPGQRVHPEVMNVESLRSIRVVKQETPRTE